MIHDIPELQKRLLEVSDYFHAIEENGEDLTVAQETLLEAITEYLERYSK